LNKFSSLAAQGLKNHSLISNLLRGVGPKIAYAVRFAAARDVTSASAFLRVNREAKLTTSSTTLACCSAVN